MNIDFALERIAKDPKLPTPPALAVEIVELANDEDCNIGEICRLVSIDPNLSGKILKTVNSAIYGLPRPVTSIKRALTTLGLAATRSIVLSLSLVDMLRQNKIGQVVEHFWAESLTGAIAARALSKRLRHPDIDDDMVAGLLRDIGMIALHQIMPDRFAKVWAHPSEERLSSLCRLEEQYCQLNHAQVGAFILTRWKLPPDIVEPIRHHHSPETGTYSSKTAHNRAFILFFATRVAQLLMLGGGAEGLYEEVRGLSRTEYNMDDDDWRQFIGLLQTQVVELAQILGVEIGRFDQIHLFLNKPVAV